MNEADRRAVADFYDQRADAEWDRLVEDVRGRVSLEVHRRFLRRYVRSGDRVLEIGAGSGRFTADLLELGAIVLVTDVSPVQLRLNRDRHGSSTGVEGWDIVDVCDTSHYADGEFDAVVAFGGPLSYAFDEAGPAIEGLLRVSRGPVVVSVMSLLGSWRHFLGGLADDLDRAGDAVHDEFLTTGDQRLLGTAHVCRLFRSAELVELVQEGGGEVLGLSASNWASLAEPDAVAAFEQDDTRWRVFLEHEVAACAEPGAVDGGTHLLAAFRTPPA